MDWTPYRLELRYPISMPGTGPMTHREGVLLHDPETGGWGDACPLPFYSMESLGDVINDLEAGRLEDSGCASVRFAVECARTPWTCGGASVAVNALWLADQEPVEDLLIRLRDWTTPTVKIKPGLYPDPDVWLRLLEARPDLRIRIDPNRCWAVEACRTYTSALPPDRLDYVEEPFSDTRQYQKLDRPDDPWIALDESLRGSFRVDALACNRLRALVMKPTLMGNAADRAPWIELAKKHGFDIVWSSSLESGIGLWHIARMAVGGPPAGLDTASWLQEDLVDPRPVTRNGFLSLPERLAVRQ